MSQYYLAVDIGASSGRHILAHLEEGRMVLEEVHRFPNGMVEKDGEMEPKIKISENVEKITNPGFKKTWRLYDRDTGKAIADVITMHDETIDDTQAYEIFHPEYTWKRKTVTNFVARPLQVPIFEKGICVYESPDLQTIQQFCKEQIDTLWDEMLRFENPHKYYVDLSQKLWDLKHALLQKYCIDCFK